MHVRRHVLPITALLLLGLGACGGSEEAPGATKRSAPTSPTASATPTPLTEDEAWAASLCGQVDVAAVAKAMDAEVFRGSIRPGPVGIPTYDTCSLVVGSEEAGSDLDLAVSATAVTDADWAAIKKYEQDTTGRYSEIEPIDVGDEGYFRAPSVAVARVGDRVVRASFRGEPVSAEEMSGVLAAAVPTVPAIEVGPAVVALPGCSEADAEAAAVLGADATLRRDGQGDDGPFCGWATSTAAVSVSAAKIDGGPSLKDDIAAFGGEEVAGLGTEAAYFGGEDGLRLSFLTANGVTVSVTVPPLLPGDKDTLVALAQKVAGLY